jgi:hypothetical protein
MIVSMINNAGWISIFYPILVFGYALLEEGRPNKTFWRIVIIYTLLILISKSIISLKVLKGVSDDI